jgi:hypothetical protein
MDIRVERHREVEAPADSDGFFKEGVSNSAIAGRCGNGEGAGYAHGRIRRTGPAAPFASLDELLAARESVRK